MSQGVPSTPRGDEVRRVSLRSSDMPGATMEEYTGRQDAVHPYALGGMVYRHTVCERYDSTLGHSVGGQSTWTYGGYRGYVDDGATAGFGHRGDGVFSSEHHGFYVDLHHTVPNVFRYLDDRARSADSDVVMQNVQTTVAVQSGLRHVAAALGEGHVSN